MFNATVSASYNPSTPTQSLYNNTNHTRHQNRSSVMSLMTTHMAQNVNPFGSGTPSLPSSSSPFGSGTQSLPTTSTSSSSPQRRTPTSIAKPEVEPDPRPLPFVS